MFSVAKQKECWKDLSQLKALVSSWNSNSQDAKLTKTEILELRKLNFLAKV